MLFLQNEVVDEKLAQLLKKGYGFQASVGTAQGPEMCMGTIQGRACRKAMQGGVHNVCKFWEMQLSRNLVKIRVLSI